MACAFGTADAVPAKAARTRRRLGLIGDNLDPASVPGREGVSGARLAEPDGRPEPWRRNPGAGLELPSTATTPVTEFLPGVCSRILITHRVEQNYSCRCARGRPGLR